MHIYLFKPLHSPANLPKSLISFNKPQIIMNYFSVLFTLSDATCVVFTEVFIWHLNNNWKLLQFVILFVFFPV